MSDLETKIIQEMVQYMTDYLEKPHPAFGGLPICPFARKARIDQQIFYKVYPFQYPDDLFFNSPLIKTIQDFADAPDLNVLLVIHPHKEAISVEEMEKFIEHLNDKISVLDLVAFGGHPGDNFNIQGVYTRQEPYLNLTVQSKQLLKESSEALQETDYYQNWTQKQLSYVGMPR